MSIVETPTGARRRVRLALRRAREAKRLTQSDVAQAMDWSLSKVMRIEKGEVSISPGDLRVLLPYLDITDPAEVAGLVGSARVSRRERWTSDPQLREHVTRATIEFLEYEMEAETIRYYCPFVVPGIFQTPEYAAAIFGMYRGSRFDESAIKVRIEARLTRAGRVLGRPDPPEYLVILDESVLHRDFGGYRVAAAQLDHLLLLAQRPAVLIRVVPFAAAGPAALMGPFTILDMGDGEPVLYRERYDNDDVVRGRREVFEHRDVFERLWSLALPDAASLGLIRDRAETMRGIADTG